MAWLAFLGPFFFISYGFANWLASRRTHVGSVAFAWEHSIPFIAWSIIPYWSIDLLYAISPFICTTRSELDRHCQRLLLVQIISIAFFVAAPLHFSFDRPETSGFTGAMFSALGSFDKPFNQAPSLHIGLLIVIWVRFAAHLRPRGRWVLHLWMIAIGLSILTTYQHHFIDLPTGLAVGFLTLWALPDEGPSPLTALRMTRDRSRARLAAMYACGALIVVALALRGGAWLWLLWPAIALLLVAANYAMIGAKGFQKLPTGRLSVGAYGLAAPYVAAAWTNSRLWTWTHPHPAEVIDGVFIGRVPRGEVPFATIIDLSAELPCRVTGDVAYRCIPVLDLTAPTTAELRDAAEEIEAARNRGSVLVCCALGYSRSAAAIIAWLVSTGRAESVDAAAAMVRRARPKVVLEDEHHAALQPLA